MWYTAMSLITGAGLVAVGLASWPAVAAATACWLVFDLAARDDDED